jgi:putative protease
MTHWVPELLSPAGSLEKLKVAVSYGADAVYCGGQKFGLRSAADNFTEFELEEGVRFAHSHGSQVYVVLNSFLHDQDLKELPEFLKVLERLKIDAVIVSDRGVVETVLEKSDLTVHLSTQASCLNAASAKLWKDRGVERIVLGREVTIDEAKRIKDKVDIELEMFVHGSMCMAYSGNCVISNYTQGRDSNRGGCAHSCRFEYSLQKENDLEKKYAHFMSSKDLQGVRVLEDFIKAGIDSLKVEGRMKSHHYAGTLSKVYGEALSFYKEQGHFLSDDLGKWENELSKVGHRDYALGSLKEPAGAESIFDERQDAKRDMLIGAVVMESRKDQYILAQVRSPFFVGDEMEIVPFKGNPVSLPIEEIRDAGGDSFTKSRPGLLWKLPFIEGVEPLNVIRINPRAES